MLLCALLIGIVAGLRSMIATTAVSIAACLGLLSLASTPLAFMGYAWTPWILGVLALGELVNDKRASTPSRTIPVQFVGRLVTGAWAGAAFSAAAHAGMLGGALAGSFGAVIGTLEGHRGRRVMAHAFHGDLPAALVEDVVAIVAAILIVTCA